MPNLKVGSRLRSSVCSTEVMVIAAPDADVDLRCGGAPMIDFESAPASGLQLDPEAKGGTQIGKRYANEAGTLELLCTKPGEGSLAADGAPLGLKGAKPLPSSD
jgi:hypothetical protein